jgi:hypothetical protein
MDKAARAALLTAKGMDKKSENIADYVADLLRQGRAKEITDDLMAQADPQRLHHHYTTGNTGMDLPMNQASRMARAREMYESAAKRARDEEFSSAVGLRTDTKPDGWTRPSRVWNEGVPTKKRLNGVSTTQLSSNKNNDKAFSQHGLGEKPPIGGGYAFDPKRKFISLMHGDTSEAGADDLESVIPNAKSMLTRDRTTARFDPRLEHLSHLGASAGGAMDFARHVEVVQRAGGQIAPSKYLPNVPRQVHAGGGKVDFVKDNPSGDWLESKQARAAQHPDMKFMTGSITGVIGGRSNMFLPTHILKGIAGLNDEVRTEGVHKYDSLLAGAQKGGFDPDQEGNKVVVGVNHYGQPYLLEGNTRVAVAHAMGVPKVKAEVRYWNGAEEADGPMRPDKVSAMASNDPDITKAGGGDVEGDNGHIYVVHGGSDFDQIDPSYSGRGEPGNIRPLGNGLYGDVIDHTDPELAARSIEGAKHYARKYGRGEKTIHVFKIPKSSSTVFNGHREVNVENYPKPIEGLGLEPTEELNAYRAHENTQPPYDPENSADYWEHSRKSTALWNAVKNAADLRMQHLPIGVTEVAIQNPKVATRIGKFSLDTPTSDILDAVKGDVQGGNITKSGGGKVVNLGKEKLVRSITKAASDVKSGAHQERMDQRAYKLHESGHLPLPIGTKVTPPQGWDMPSELHIHGYWQDILHPEQHGYKLKSESGDLYEVQHQMHSGQNPYVFGGGFKAYSGPVRNRAGYSDEAMAPRNPTFPTRTPEQSDQLNKEYDQLFGNDPDITKSGGGSVTDSDEFRNWFGNSVTHTDGDPHVFYTGTSKDKDFTSFNVGRHGAWFTRDPAEASEYAERNDSQGHKYDGWKITETNTASRVIPAYVRAENPYTGDLPDEVLRDNYKKAQSDWFDTLRRKGHDAWIPARHNGDLVVVLKEPQQIKSIFNNGKFDPNQKHMNKAGGGEVDGEDDGVTAYHGSPHSFDQFDISKLGTGEGAQAFGHGLYFAGNEKIAKHYRDALGGNKSVHTMDGLPFDPSTISETERAVYNRVAPSKKTISEHLDELRSLGSSENSIQEMLPYLEKYTGRAKRTTIPAGHMYKVKLNVKPHELLDWDKPLSEQHPKVQRAIKEWNDWRPAAEKLPKEIIQGSGIEPNGSHIYQHISNIAQPNNGNLYGNNAKGQEFASGELQDMGLKGIRYRDAGSRDMDTDGDPTHNYVMFHHDPVQVVDKYEYGGTVGKEEGGATGSLREKALWPSAQAIKAGTGSREAHEALVNKIKPVSPYAAPVPPAPDQQVHDALTKDKQPKAFAPRQLKEGTPVAVRLDIPAYEKRNTWVVSVHHPKSDFTAGEVIGYDSVAHIGNPRFGVHPTGALNIASGKPKATIATVHGNWKKTTPEDAFKLSQTIHNDPQWRQVGMDPERHSYFYDRETQEPVMAADEALHIGPLVYAKNPVYGKKTDFAFSSGGTVNKAGGGEVEQMEQPANGMHMLRMRRAGINTKEDFWNRWRDHMRAKAAPNLNLSAIGSKDSHFQQIDNLLNFHRQAAGENGIRSVLQRYGQNGQNREDGSMAASMPKAILQGAGIEPTVDNASQIYHSLPDDESGRVGKAGGGEMEGVESNNQNGGLNVGPQNETGTAPFNPTSRAQAGELRDTGRVRGGSGVLQAPDEAPLEGLLTPVTIPMTGQVIHAAPAAHVRQVARDYMASTGLPYNPPKKYAKADPARSLRISDAYEDMKDNSSDPLTKASYAAMIKETMAQYHAAKAAGFKAEFWNPQTEEDPYFASPRLATEDIKNNNHMFVFPTDSGYGSDGPITAEQIKTNPLLQPSGETWNGIPVTVNDIFRAVHDYFGHAKEGVGFRADGEENAWRSHAAMYSPLARMAMTSETRGQNSWLNFNPTSGERNRKARTENSTFADQKVGILPHWVHHEGAEDFMVPEDVNAMSAIRKVHGRASGGMVDKALALTRRFTKDGIGATVALKPKGK